MRRFVLAGIAVAGLGLVGSAAALGGDNDIAIESNDLGSAKGFSYRSATYENHAVGGTAYAVAQCPGKKVPATGGGEVSGNPAEAWITDLGPEFLDDADVPDGPRDAWTAGVKNDSGATKNTSAYAICAKARLFDYGKRRKGGSVTGTLLVAKARCPGEAQVVGGGFHNQDNFGTATISAPFDGGDKGSKPDDGWRVRVTPAQDDRNLVVRAVCSAKLDLTYRRDTLPATTTGGYGQTSVCPDTHAVTGGGIEIGGGDGWIAKSAPIDSGDDGSVPDDTWATIAQITAVPAAITVHSVCAR